MPSDYFQIEEKVEKQQRSNKIPKINKGNFKDGLRTTNLEKIVNFLKMRFVTLFL